MATGPTETQQPNQLLSPWARRFGLSDEADDSAFKRGPVQHSGFGPEHPVFYADRPSILGTGIFPRESEKDRLFFSDALHHAHFEGILPWQYGPLNLALRFSDKGYIPGGHQQVTASAFAADPKTRPGWIPILLYHGELIKPNEESWLPFLRKDRWFNFGDGEPLLSGGAWSIDHPLVWEVMSISLELANRILIALIEDSHSFLHTVLYGMLGPWDEVANLIAQNIIPAPFPEAKVLISYELFEENRDTADPRLCDYMDIGASYTPDDHKARLEALAEELTWSFIDSADYIAATHEIYASFITLSTGPLKTIIEGNITLAERCILQFSVALTILHELYHALMNARMHEVWEHEEDKTTEPFVDFSGAAELGYAFEQAVFGGTFRLSSEQSLPPLGFYSINWPWPHHQEEPGDMHGIQYEGHDDFSEGKLIEKVLIPAEFVSRMLSDSYWKDEGIPRKSDNFFQRTSLFVSRTAYESTKPLHSYMQNVVIDNQRDQSQLSNLERFMINEWRDREALWNSLRSGWYELERNTWLASEWKYMGARHLINDFAKGRRIVDLVACVQSAESLVQYVPWDANTSRIMYTNALNQEWIFHAIGLLMMAAMPIRNQGQTMPAQHLDNPIVYSPSDMAKDHRETIVFHQDKFKEEQICTASRFFDPLYREGQVISDYTQLDYLDLVHKILEYFAVVGRTVSGPWLKEILRVGKSLRQQRQMMQQITPVSERIKLWAPTWDFEVPEYDPTAGSRWDRATSRWVHVER
ncbi:hypothetical protein F5Y19DRAFT_481665 [Xylariaceae sp. FL1651]|nr:hypothetical protein F5Y19DRAFT_481665 [Xylariaceae sp. FL1651]